MAKDRTNMGGPTNNPKDEPTENRDNPMSHDRSAQSQSLPIGDGERRNRADEFDEERGRGTNPRTGSDSNQSKSNRGG